ncbi:hypothetical protein DM81_5453 [Burkholderia multivorans]|nr:hypothetical protein DM81_5453 [Burkholderia multivorans]
MAGLTGIVNRARPAHPRLRESHDAADFPHRTNPAAGREIPILTSLDATISASYYRP